MEILLQPKKATQLRADIVRMWIASQTNNFLDVARVRTRAANAQAHTDRWTSEHTRTIPFFQSVRSLTPSVLHFSIHSFPHAPCLRTFILHSSFFIHIIEFMSWHSLSSQFTHSFMHSIKQSVSQSTDQPINQPSVHSSIK